MENRMINKNPVLFKIVTINTCLCIIKMDLHK
jgi:hypothetical protein